MNTPNNFRLENQVIIVTGGAGLLGKQYAYAIAEVGGVPVIADRDADAAMEIAKAVTVKTGMQALGLYVDVTNKDSVDALIEQTLKRFGRIDGLINNAAINPKFEDSHPNEHTYSFENYPLDLWNQSLAVNITGMFLCAQAVAKVMLSQGKGSIINIASTYGLVGPDQRIYQKADPKAQVNYKPVAYSVTKSAVLGLTRYLATYWAGKNIRVNTLTPGGVYNDHDDEFVHQYSHRTPLGRMARQDEYNGAVVFLLSDASSYMTGSNLIVDGGWTAW
jgi:NAD(P)-dependent dehydrogenase (short-subunit alcohol dehydrogenase family)